MGLFKKIIKNNDTNKKEEIEIVDFNEPNEKAIVNSLEERKDNRIIIIILLIVILFALFIPYITSIFKESSNYNYTTNVENDASKGTVNGLLLIGSSEGYMKTKDIQFYLFSKRNSNTISYSYKVDKTINNIPKLNLFIELYNSSQTLIFRELFNPSIKLQKGVKSGELQLNSQIYKEAEYAKIVEIKDFSNNIDSILICTKTVEDGNFELNLKTIYNFSKNSLVTYETDKVAEYTPCTTCEETEKDKYNTLFKKEEANILNTNTEDVILEENHINYIINLRTYEQNNSDYVVLYGLGTVLKTVKITEELNGWNCE